MAAAMGTLDPVSLTKTLPTGSVPPNQIARPHRLMRHLARSSRQTGRPRRLMRHVGALAEQDRPVTGWTGALTRHRVDDMRLTRRKARRRSFFTNESWRRRVCLDGRGEGLLHQGRALPARISDNEMAPTRRHPPPAVTVQTLLDPLRPHPIIMGTQSRSAHRPVIKRADILRQGTLTTY
jgi:hypothetical protein